MSTNSFSMYDFIQVLYGFHAIVCEKGDITNEQITNTFQCTYG